MMNYPEDFDFVDNVIEDPLAVYGDIPSTHYHWVEPVKQNNVPEPGALPLILIGIAAMMARKHLSSALRGKKSKFNRRRITR